MTTTTLLASRWSLVGIAAGAIALLLAVTHFWAGPFAEPTPIENTIAEKAVAIRDATLAAMRGEEHRAGADGSRWDADRITQLAIAMLSACAIVIAVIGFARGESTRAAGGALLIGLTALTLQFAIAFIGALLFVILIAAVISQLDFGCCCG